MITGLDNIRYRLAKYYLGRLRAADTAYRRGQGSSAESLALLGQDWAQIVQWQAWTAAGSAQSQEAAHLCAAYPQAGADILITRQTPSERIAWLDAGRLAAHAVGDVHAEAVCLFRLAWAIHKQADLEHAEAVAYEALDRSQAIGDSLLMGRSTHLLGEIALRHGNVDEAQRLHEHSLALLHAVDAQPALADVYFSLSEIAYLRCDYVSAREYALKSHRIFTALGLNPTTNNNLTWLGVTTAEVGDLDAAEQYVRQSVAFCRSSGAHSTLAHGLYTLCELMLMRKAFAQARIYVEESLQFAKLMSEEWLIPYILISKGDLDALTGDLIGAQRTLDQAVALARGNDYRLALVKALIHLARVQIAANETHQAGASLYEGLEAAVQTGMRIEIVYGVFVAAKLWQKLGAAGRAAELAGQLQHCQGVEYAVRSELPALCAELTSQLDEERFAAAVKRGRALDLDAVVGAVMHELAERYAS